MTRKEKKFGLVRFYAISTIVGYLMSNPQYTYILNLETHFVDNIFKWAWAHFLAHRWFYTIKWSSSSISDNSI